jgi:hypothetical protein
VVDGYKFSDEEQNYYFDRFGAAGTETPAFITRTLTLTASQVYCSADSFQRLQKNQPEATKRFMNIYGCALGKPWYMPDSEFSSACPNIASNK